jgi:putative membrane protein
MNDTRARSLPGGVGSALGVSVTLALIIAVFVTWLTYGRTEVAHGPMWVGSLAAVAAAANTACVIALLLGWRAIRRGLITRHRNFMLSAIAFSAVFFVSYVVRHYYHGDTPFDGTGLIRVVYLTILATHILGSVLVLVLLPLTLIFVGRQRFDLHRAVNRWFLPIWLYVSATGVLIYFMLR